VTPWTYLDYIGSRNDPLFRVDGRRKSRLR